MRIAFIVPGMGMGGAERVISILSKGLIEKGHSVNIGMLNIEPQTVAYALDDKVVVENITSHRFGSPIQIWRTLSNIEEYLKKVKPDIVISFTNVICAQVSIACKKLGIPVIFSERNDPRKLLTGVKEKIFQWLLIHNVKYMVFQTEGAKGIYPKRITDHSQVILNPLDTSKFPPYFEGPRKKEIVTVGRLEPQKRQDVLIRAFTAVAEAHPDVILRIYGEGSQRETLMTLIAELQMEKRIMLMGNRGNIFEHINESAIFALTSDFEGLPNALIEAMALGLPCVSTRCSPGGAEEIIVDGENGLLVPCGDVSKLTEALMMMLERETVALEMGRKARDIRSRVDSQEIIDSWERYIWRVINKL